MPNLNNVIAERPVALMLTVANLFISILAFSKKDLYLKWILHPYTVFKQKKYYRLLTSGFVHNDIIHLLINVMMIGLIGGELEKFLRERSFLGSLEFTEIYLISHFTGAIVVSFANKNNCEYSSAGASGSILGCVMGFTILAPHYIAFYLPVFGEVQNIFAALAVIIGLIVYKWKSGNDLVDHELHFFSAIGGILSSLAISFDLL